MDREIPAKKNRYCRKSIRSLKRKREKNEDEASTAIRKRTKLCDIENSESDDQYVSSGAIGVESSMGTSRYKCNLRSYCNYTTSKSLDTRKEFGDNCVRVISFDKYLRCKTLVKNMKKTIGIQNSSVYDNIYTVPVTKSIYSDPALKKLKKRKKKQKKMKENKTVYKSSKTIRSDKKFVRKFGSILPAMKQKSKRVKQSLFIKKYKGTPAVLKEITRIKAFNNDTYKFMKSFHCEISYECLNDEQYDGDKIYLPFGGKAYYDVQIFNNEFHELDNLNFTNVYGKVFTMNYGFTAIKKDGLVQYSKNITLMFQKYSDIMKSIVDLTELSLKIEKCEIILNRDKFYSKTSGDQGKNKFKLIYNTVLKNKMKLNEIYESHFSFRNSASFIAQYSFLKKSQWMNYMLSTEQCFIKFTSVKYVNHENFQDTSNISKRHAPKCLVKKKISKETLSKQNIAKEYYSRTPKRSKLLDECIKSAKDRKIILFTKNNEGKENAIENNSNKEMKPMIGKCNIDKYFENKCRKLDCSNIIDPIDEEINEILSNLPPLNNAVKQCEEYSERKLDMCDLMKTVYYDMDNEKVLTILPYINMF